MISRVCSSPPFDYSHSTGPLEMIYSQVIAPVGEPMRDLSAGDYPDPDHATCYRRRDHQ